MMRRTAGFTLLEVLVALAIVAMSVGALLGTVTSSASNVIYLKDKTLSEWVALNRLTEVRIDKDLPDKGKRAGDTVMGGVRYEWEEEVVELPIKGLLRIDVRAHSTGELIDDTRPVDKPTAQKLSKSSPSGSSHDKTPWTTTVTGVISSSRSQLPTPVATPLVGSLQTGTPNTPNNGGGNTNTGGNNPNNPTPPNTPGTPGTGVPNPPKPPPQDR